MTTSEYVPPRAATLHLGGDAWAHPDLEPLVRDLAEHNIRRHPDNPRRGDHEAIVDSVRVNGVYTPPKVQRSTGYVLAGNHSFDAITDQGGTRMPWVWLDVDDDEARRIMLADNRTAELGGYDQALLLDQVRAAQAADGLLAGTGYTTDDLAELERAADAALAPFREDPDQSPIPEVPDDPITQHGDTWVLGRHRIRCGSTLDTDDLDALLDTPPDLVHTDPPYGISIVNVDGKVGGDSPLKFGGKTGKIGKARGYLPVAGDETTEAAVRAFALLTVRYPKAVQVWWGGNHYAGDARLPNASCWIVWDKENDAMTFADAELAWTNHPGAVRIFRHQWDGLRRASERGVVRDHPTQKPVALAQWVATKVKRDQPTHTVFDAFGGAGFVLLACEQNGSSARIMELAPGYVDVMCRRWQKLTGLLPTRNGEAHDFST